MKNFWNRAFTLVGRTGVALFALILFIHGSTKNSTNVNDEAELETLSDLMAVGDEFELSERLLAADESAAGVETLTNAFRITDLEIDKVNQAAYFKTQWETNLFDYTASRNLYLFSSTNLLECKWTPLCTIPVPEDTNVYSFVVTQDEIIPSMRHWFVDTFGGVGFYHIGLDFDSDGDGIADEVETLWTFTDSTKFDSDGDGLSDGKELSSDINTNPLESDTDGDGVSDSDEIAFGCNPRKVNSDQDNLTDAQEIGTMVALEEDDFMWFDLSSGADLLSNYSNVDNGSWVIPLASEVAINEVCYTNARVCLDGTVHLLCPTNVTGWASNYSDGLSNSQWSTTHLTIVPCSADLYVRTSDWGSQILYGSASSEDGLFDVIEYHNIGLYSHRNTNELITCQVILPHNETNTVYVSYLCASNAFREVDLVAGIQCGWISSIKSGEKYYNLSWPTSSGFPQDRLTIKYSIGTSTDPTKTDTDGDGLSDSEEVLICHTNPLVVDTDGDTISDYAEVSIGTNPQSTDTDADGMPDDWEVDYEFNPLVNDSSFDFDRDGLPNLAEYKAGTSPVNSDTDGDGIGDRDELGWWEYVDGLPSFDTSSGTNLLESTRNYDGQTFAVSLPFTFSCVGFMHTNVTICLDGVVGLRSDRSTSPFSVSHRNSDIVSITFSSEHTAVAAYWDDLYAKAGGGAQIRVADLTVDTKRYAVIEYANMRLYERRNDTETTGTFQVIIPEAETNTVYVRYVNMAGLFDGSFASIGAQLPKGEKTFSVAYNAAGLVTNGMTIAYHFGAGGNPLIVDTDADGLSDDEELFIGTSLRYADTDGDGIDDAWEHAYGLDPVSAAGDEGADGDKDGDGLCNFLEYKIGTNPIAADTDGDGLLDLEETGMFDVSGTMSWVAMPADAVDVTSQFSNADGSLVEYELSTPMFVNGEELPKVVIDVNGIIYLPRSGHEKDFSVRSSANLEYAICTDALVLAPYLNDLYLTTNVPASKVSVAETFIGGKLVFVIQYENVCPYSNRSRTSTTNALSFQVVIHLNGDGDVHFLYKDVVGEDMDGRNANIGLQMLGGRHSYVYAYHSGDRVRGDGNPMRAFFTQGSLYNGLDLVFNLGFGSSPLLFDTDEDGLYDGQEWYIGTSTITGDTDGDNLPDNWEVQHYLNPILAIGDDGCFGDPDEDGVDNYTEYKLGTDPNFFDTDGDGLLDGQEVVCASLANSLPWLEIFVLTNMTEVITNDSNRVVSYDLPSPILVQSETVTNITLNTRGVVCLNRVGYTHPNSSHSPYNFQTETVDTNAFVIVAYGGDLDFYEIEQASSVRIGAAEYEGVGYIVVEYDNMYQNRPTYTTNAISFQIAIPTGRVDKISINYANLMGTDMTGLDAIIGCQSFGAESRVTYCRYEQGMIYDGMSLSFVVGYDSNPLVTDTDGDGISDYQEVNTYKSNPRLIDTDSDGLSDGQEVELGTALNSQDSDNDGLLDGWEVSNGFNPLSAADSNEATVDTDGDGLTNLQEQQIGTNPKLADTDGDGLSDSAESLTYHTNPLVADTDDDGMTDKQETDANYDPLNPDMDRDGMPDGWENDNGLDSQDFTGNDGADGDPDNDGLSNIDEYLNETNPNLPDTDGDGISDSVEVANGSNPNDATDGGHAPSANRFREIRFNINGDYAAWEMTIKGLGPDDTRIRKISMGRPNAANTTILKMQKGNSYRLSMRWLNCDGHNDKWAPWYCWQAQLDSLPTGSTFQSYTNIRREGHEVVVGDGWIADNTDGLLTSHIHECTTNSDGSCGGGNVAGSLTATLYVLDDPKLVPDYDRDGAITDDDVSKVTQQKKLRFWINDDEDDSATDGKYAESSSVDIPGARAGWLEFDRRTPDWDDSSVDGYRDLIDFTPVFLDVSMIQSLPEKIRNNLSFKLSHASELVNVVWTGLSKSSVGLFQKEDVGVCGRSLNGSSYEADVEQVVSDGIFVPNELAAQMKSSAANKGVVFIEGRGESSDPLKLDIYYNNQKVVSGELPMQISSVEEMYRFYSLHGTQKVDSFNLPNRYTPRNLMDNPKDRDVFFTHGFNVSEEDARAWGTEVFKRLWQSGSDARFHMIAWPGNYNWTGDWANGLHYQRDVYHALKSANAFKRLVEREQNDSSKRVIMAQSLGNMMVCEALRQGLNANQYFMFNAAVASEAIDATYQNDSTSTRNKYVPSDWYSYDSRSWAANWHKWFKNDITDARGKMGWPDYFKTALTHVGNVYNYYSTGDPVFMEESSVPSTLAGVFHWPTLHLTWPFIDLNITTEANCWQKQETHKGIDPIAGTLRGGWGFYYWMEVTGEDVYTEYYSAATTSVMVANGSITNNPVFYYPGTKMDNRDASQDDIWFALAEYVPAISSPVGGKVTASEQLENYDLNSSIYRNEWGRDSDFYGANWLHSDMKDMAYFYVYPLYDELKTKGNLK